MRNNKKRIDFSPDEILVILQTALNIKGSTLSKKEKRQAINDARKIILLRDKAFQERKQIRIAIEKKKIEERWNNESI